MVAWTTPRTWVVGEAVTAAELNSNIRDNEDYLFGSGSGSEVGYDQVTGTVTVTSSTEATGTSVIPCAAHTFDGAAVMAEFFCPEGTAASAGGAMGVCLFEGTTEVGRLTGSGLGDVNPNNHIPILGRLRFTPTAGSHTYTVTAFVAGGNGALICGAGGVAANPPMFIRFVKV